MVDELADYAFVDALVIDFKAEPDLSMARLVCEAYGPLTTAGSECEREFGLVAISLADVVTLHVDAKREFRVDLRRPYAHGHTYETN